MTCSIVEPVYSRKKEAPRAFLESIVGDARTNETKRVEKVVSSRNVEGDLKKAMEVRILSMHVYSLLHLSRSETRPMSV